MRAVRLHAPHEPLRFEEVPLPQPSGTEVRIRVAGAGVCRTDLHIVDGSQSRVVLPRTLGHEVAGWVEAVGPGAAPALADADLAEGDAVVVHGGWGCGECGECAAGQEQRCERAVSPGFQADGGYADAMTVPHPRHLVALGDLDPVAAAPLGDAGITAYRAIRRAEPWLRDGARVLVIGAGALGQFALQLVRVIPAAGRSLVVAVREISADRLEYARDLGADLGMLEVDPVQTMGVLGGPADVVLDFVGADATLAHAADVVAPGGAILLVGEAGGTLAFGFDRPSIEAWLTTVAWGSAADLRDVVDLARDGKLQWRTETMPLASATQAHERLREGRVTGRIVLAP